MKELLDEGLVFYNKYESKKGKDIAENPQISAIFYWECLSRQIRVQGKVEKAPDFMADDYFASRPRGSQLGAWASKQSDVIAEDRKSTRLNSSHVRISYAVFCLKKKKKNKT